MAFAILLNLTVWDIAGAAEVTKRYGSHGYNDPSAAGYYEPRLRQPLLFRRDMFAQNTTGGPTRVSWGDLRLLNDDGGLDTLRSNFGLAGWKAEMLIGDPDGVYSGFEKLFIGRTQQALFTLGGNSPAEVILQLRDRLQDLQQPVQATKYLGDNALPNGLEGVSDLKGKPKPVALGDLTGNNGNVSPPLVNTSRLIYQVHDGLVSDVPAVFDAGAGLTKGADYTSQSDMETNAPTAGQYRVWKSSTGSYFRLGSSPSGAITCDILEGATAADRTAAQVAYRLATRTGGIATADVSTADRTALDTANSAVVGIWIDAETQFGSALEPVLRSPGAWFGFDRTGIMRMQRLELPGVTPAATFRQFGLGSDAATGDFDIIDCRFLPTSDPDRGLPAYEIVLEWGRNWTVQQGDGLAGAVTAERRNFLAEATRTVTSTDNTVKTAHPLAVQKKVATLLQSQSAAQTEADRLLTMFKTPRDFIEIDTPMTSSLIAALDIGSTVKLVIPRFGYSAGKNLRVTGMQYDALQRKVTLALWG